MRQRVGMKEVNIATKGLHADRSSRNPIKQKSACREENGRPRARSLSGGDKIYTQPHRSPQTGERNKTKPRSVKINPPRGRLAWPVVAHLRATPTLHYTTGQDPPRWTKRER